MECGQQALRERIGRRVRAKKPDHRLYRLLRARRERPRGCRAAEKGHELAASHGLPLRPSMISYFVVGIPRSASQENWPPMAATAAALRIRAKAAILVGEAEQRRRHRRMPSGWTRRISLSLRLRIQSSI